MMKLRDGATLAAIIGGLALMFGMTRYVKPERVRPGSPEYVAYIEHYVGECMRNPLAYELTPMTSQSAFEEACRAAVLRADRFNPQARPLKH